MLPLKIFSSHRLLINFGNSNNLEIQLLLQLLFLLFLLPLIINRYFLDMEILKCCFFETLALFRSLFDFQIVPVQLKIKIKFIELGQASHFQEYQLQWLKVIISFEDSHYLFLFSHAHYLQQVLLHSTNCRFLLFIL